MEGLEICRSPCSIAEKNPLPCEPKSRAARRRRMEIRKFKVIATSPIVKPTETSRKRLKITILGRDFARDCVNAIESSMSGAGVELDPATIDASTSGNEEKAVFSAFPLTSEAKLQETGSAGLKEEAADRTDGCSVGVDNICPEHAFVSVCGRRREMEDAVSILPAFNCTKNENNTRSDPALHFFGVYDGHGGSQAALFCKERLHEVLAEELKIFGGNAQDETQWQQLTSACFGRVDAEILSGGIVCRNDCITREGNNECSCGQRITSEAVGTTAVVAIVGSSQIVVANCGDSRAILSRGGRPVVLSQDHKPDRPDEMERIEAAGGRVFFWNGPRVLGVLAMSRAIGDKYLKPYVIAKPEVTINARSDEDEFLILASDGLWDVLSNEVVCEVARRCLSGRSHRSYSGLQAEGRDDTPAAIAAALLTKLAIARGSQDNITVVVVDLQRRRRHQSR